MRLNLSSQIVLNKVPVEFYKPKTTVEYSEISRMEKIHTDIFASVSEGCSHIADCIEKGIKAAQHEGKYYVMALGTGLSVNPVYDELVSRYEKKKLSFRNVVVFNAYEYYPLRKDSSIRSINQLKEHFLDRVDIAEQNIFTLDGSIAQEAVQDTCRLYEQRIKTFGGLDATILGIGRMGNIAANEPGSSIQSLTRIILIGNMSREEMENSFKTKEQVPPCSLTMGVGTLLTAKTVFLTAWGDEKSEIMQKVIEGNITDTLPATFLQTHPNAQVVLDLSAAAHLTRIEHPWLVSSCEWTDKLVRSALVWLCQKINKPILKLTNKDYNENGLSELLALYGSAYNANIKIFNDLQHTITGWPGGKPDADDTYRPERAKPYPKRVVVFSPHPDDDVISMGGTIRRLVQQHHDVHLAYETSGNIAVGDEEVTRFMHFINGFNQLFAESKDSIIANMEFKGSAVKKMYMLPVSVPAMYLCKFLILTVMFLVAIVLQNLALAQIGMTDLPDGAFEMGTLVRFAGYSFLTSMPVLSFMLLISSRFENMWVPLGIGVAGFLSGMALANSGLTLLLVHPFVIILKPAVAMSAQPDSTVALVALVETLLFLAVGLWLAKYRRYE